MNYSDLYRSLAGYGMGILIFVIIIALGMLALVILYMLTLQNTLAAVSPQNRKMAPGLVWLSIGIGIVGAFVPYPINIIFSIGGVVFMFFVVKSIAESLDAEYRMRGVNAEPKPTFNIGMAYVGVSALGTILSLVGISVAVLSGLLGLASLVCWIIYWVQVSQNKKRVQALPMMQQGSSQIFGV